MPVQGLLYSAGDPTKRERVILTGSGHEAFSTAVKRKNDTERDKTVAHALTESWPNPMFGHMSEAPDCHELARQIVALEGRMNTHQAEYRTDIARLGEDMAKRDAKKAESDYHARVWMIALFLAYRRSRRINYCSRRWRPDLDQLAYRQLG